MKNINTIYKDLLSEVWNEGLETSPRGKKILELIGKKIILDPDDCIITLENFETNLHYATIESAWYESGMNSIDFHPLITKIWSKYSDDGKTVNSAYGYYIFNAEHFYKENLQIKSQWSWVKEKLKQDPESRQAVININNISHKKNINTKDFPCTIALQFFIRNNQLDMIVMMRSNDLFYGFRNDIYCFSQLQKQMAEELNVELGQYIHFASSLHLYEGQFAAVNDLLKGDD